MKRTKSIKVRDQFKSSLFFFSDLPKNFLDKLQRGRRGGGREEVGNIYKKFYGNFEEFIEVCPKL